MARKNTRSNDNPDTSLAAPQTRKERFLAKAAGLVAQAPIGQYNRLERYLQAIIERLDAGFYPSEAQLAAINSGATEAKINAIETKLPQYGMGKNLLRNAYFVGGGSQKGYGTFPINQRDGYVVPDGVTYYSDTALTTSVGTTDAYTSVTKVSATYGSIDVSGTTYYVSMGDAVTGYIGSGYNIDGWLTYRNDVVFRLNNSGLRITQTNSGSVDAILQRNSLSFWEQLAGKVVTLSALTTDGKFGTQTMTLPLDTSITWDTAEAVIPGVGFFDIYGAPTSGACGVRFVTYDELLDMELKAVKLELGNTQTLCHNEGTDANPVWVLNEVPDYGEELRRCQEWQQEINLFNEWFPRAGFGQAQTAKLALVDIPLTTTLRGNPIISFRGEWMLEKMGVSGSLPVARIEHDNLSSNIETVKCYVEDDVNLTKGDDYRLAANGDPYAKLLLDANP